jgi:hypothetical protein
VRGEKGVMASEIVEWVFGDVDFLWCLDKIPCRECAGKGAGGTVAFPALVHREPTLAVAFLMETTVSRASDARPAPGFRKRSSNRCFSTGHCVESIARASQVPARLA